MAQHADLQGVRQVGAQPRQVQVGVDQLHQHVALAEEQEGKPLAQGSARTAEMLEQWSRVLPHGARRSHLPRGGPQHELPVAGVVMLGGEVEVGETLLGPGHEVEVVGLAIIGEAGSEGESFGQPAGTAPGKPRDDDASPRRVGGRGGCAKTFLADGIAGHDTSCRMRQP
jgi:hypothetical protein